MRIAPPGREPRRVAASSLWFQFYVFTVENGMCFQDNKLRAFGAGLLSSASELEVSNILYSSIHVRLSSTQPLLMYIYL